MKKKLKTNFKVWDAIFTNRIHCYIGYSEDEFEKILKRQYSFRGETEVVGFQGKAISIQLESGTKVCLLWLKKFEWAICDMEVLIHEISHAADYFFEANDVPLNKDTGEFRALYIGGVFSLIARRLKKLL